ncbi:putative membrane protein [Limimaricola soesokkakensis]|uniref:Putative membrane protein n=1 Tax=Limimaricola soesokkakensis TaxID=1343159 RepID=A0A1X6ZJ84_9RHOB|nr:DUF599 domain-containing protein [Limimaricola soesokkakensis]PSK84889.1 putative membrane protein [Limimaricola soesokkakensis]SLN52752.1 hypothetical protein LOS8367_02437 [Limimaricola soesokkakensis]
MDPLASLPHLTLFDTLGLALMLVGYWLIGWRIEHPGRRPSVTVLMAEHRREWMREFVLRGNRIFDATIMGSLRQGTSFFASTCLLAVGGVLALIGNTEPLQGVAEGFGQDRQPDVLWQIKLLPVALLLTHAFLKFVWAHRIFGYCSVLMASVPNAAEDPRALPRAMQAAELNIRAAWNFNRGLRAMYFALGALAWLLGGWALILAMAAVLWVLWSREFASVPRAVLLEQS